MPDPLELPGVLGAVVPLVGAGEALVLELVAHRLPGFAPVVGALELLAEPAAGLRGIDPVRLGGGSFEMIDLPARKVGPADLPGFARAVRAQDKSAFARADQ